MGSKMKKFTLLALMGVFSSAGIGSAHAEDSPYTLGPVTQVTNVRTVWGKTGEYMKYLGTTWKQEQEAAKKAGIILSYQVFLQNPATADDADIVLAVTMKNWAAFDTLDDKLAEIDKTIEGSDAAAAKGNFDRNIIRHILSIKNIQGVTLK
jgi:hypothetical protein